MLQTTTIMETATTIMTVTSIVTTIDKIETTHIRTTTTKPVTVHTPEAEEGTMDNTQIEGTEITHANETEGIKTG